MIGPMTDERRARLRSAASLIGLAVLVALLAAHRNRLGVRLVPDGWAVWEASVSLLERGTYAYFAGDPIRYWPPLPALLLAGLQAVLGVSGGALCALLALSSGLGWLGWALVTDAALVPRDLPPGRRLALRAAVGLLHAGLVLLAAGTLLAHTLLLALVPWWLLALTAAADGRRHAPTLLAASGALLLLTHNTAIVWWPGAALLLLSGARGARERVVALLPLAASVVVWLLARAALDQGASHPLALGGRHGPTAYVTQAVTGLGTLVAPSSPAAAFLAGVALLAAWLLAARVGVGRARDLARVSLLALVGLFALFNVIWVFDRLDNRFMWVFPLLAVPVAAAALVRRAPRLTLALVLASAVMPVARVVVQARVDWTAVLGDDLVRPRAWISTRPVDPSDARAADRIEPWRRPWTHTTAEEDRRRFEALLGY